MLLGSAFLLLRSRKFQPPAPSYEIQNLFLTSLDIKLNHGAGMTSFLQDWPIMTRVTQTQTLPCTVYTCISVKSRLRSSKQHNLSILQSCNIVQNDFDQPSNVYFPEKAHPKINS